MRAPRDKLEARTLLNAILKTMEEEPHTYRPADIRRQAKRLRLCVDVITKADPA